MCQDYLTHQQQSLFALLADSLYSCISDSSFEESIVSYPISLHSLLFDFCCYLLLFAVVVYLLLHVVSLSLLWLRCF